MKLLQSNLISILRLFPHGWSTLNGFIFVTFKYTKVFSIEISARYSDIFYVDVKVYVRKIKEMLRILFYFLQLFIFFISNLSLTPQRRQSQ